MSDFHKGTRRFDDVDADSVTTDSATVNGTTDTDALEATAELGNPTYATLSDVPTTLTEGTQVYVEDENAIYVEDGT
jgi:3D (Asp-Asp-Asp) domain-containing protein